MEPRSNFFLRKTTGDRFSGENSIRDSQNIVELCHRIFGPILRSQNHNFRLQNYFRSYEYDRCDSQVYAIVETYQNALGLVLYVIVSNPFVRYYNLYNNLSIHKYIIVFGSYISLGHKINKRTANAYYMRLHVVVIRTSGTKNKQKMNEKNTNCFFFSNA